MKYLVDTDVMIDFFKLKEPAKSLIQQLNKDTQIALSAVTITEIRSGWSPEQASHFLPQLYQLCTIEVVTKEIAEHAGVWRQQYMGRGRPLSATDTIIAATAYTKGYSLITNNRKDYPMPELTLYLEKQL